MKFASALMCFSALVAAPAIAQEQSDETTQDESQTEGDRASSSNTIIVTAQRREQAITDVPVAITALSSEALEARGVANTAQLGSVVPNLQVNSAFGNTQPNFALRGVSVVNEFNVNQASPIGVYIDDVYIANRTSQGQGLFDLERVEVLRGPQGTLFGRNTTGGTINLITRSPDLNGSNGFLEVGYGNFDTFTAQGAIEATLIENQLGVRLAANVIQGDGKFENVVPGVRDPGSEDVLQGRISVRARPGDGPLDIKVRAYGGRSRGAQNPAVSSTSTGLEFFQVRQNRVGDYNTEAYGIAANIAYELSDIASITSITSYDAGEQFLDFNADGSPIDLLATPRRAKYDQFSEELRTNISLDRLELVAGVYYGTDTVRVNNRYLIGAPVAGLPFAVGYFQRYRQTRDSVAVFAQGDYELSEQLTLTVGARYTWDDAKYRDGRANLFAFLDDTFDSDTFVLAETVFDPDDPAQDFSLDGSNKALTGRIALAYEFEDGTLAFASYNRGYRSGAFNGGSYTSTIGINYVDPEKVNAYEVGLKGSLGAMTYSAAGFYYDYSDQQLTDLRPGPISFLVNAPKARILGAELETSTYVSNWLDIDLSLSYLDTEYKELSLEGVVLDGNKLPFAPEFSAQGSLNFTLFDTGDQRLMFRPSAVYTSQRYFSPFNEIDGSAIQNNVELQQGSTFVVDLNLAYEFSDFRVTGFVRNLFNEEIYSYGLDLRGAGFGFNLLVPQQPRTYGVQLRASF